MQVSNEVAKVNSADQCHAAKEHALKASELYLMSLMKGDRGMSVPGRQESEEATKKVAAACALAEYSATDLLDEVEFTNAGLRLKKKLTENSKSKTDDSTWYGNPEKVVLTRKGETLDDLANRLMNKRVDSLGLKLDDFRAVYQSGPITVSGIFQEPGHPISEVTQSCNAKDQLTLGPKFEDIGCESDSFRKLATLSASAPIKYHVYCSNQGNNSDKEIIGYLNLTSNVFWRINKGAIFSLGISNGKFNPLENDSSVDLCKPSTLAR
jgi:hypothetical protein